MVIYFAYPTLYHLVSSSLLSLGLEYEPIRNGTDICAFFRDDLGANPTHVGLIIGPTFVAVRKPEVLPLPLPSRTVMRAATRLLHWVAPPRTARGN